MAVLLAAGAGRWLGESLLQLLRVVIGSLIRPSAAERPPQTVRCNTSGPTAARRISGWLLGYYVHCLNLRGLFP